MYIIQFLAKGRLLRWPPFLFHPMQSIKHHTIVTGHIREIHPEEYDPGIIKKTREAIDYALGETEPVALFRGLDPDAKFSFETFSGDGLKCTIYGKTGDPCIIFIVVRQANSIARRQYAELMKIDHGSQRYKSKMPEAPFCSVALTKHLENPHNQKMLKWVGDYEACASVAWLYNDMIISAEEFDNRAQARENIRMWIILGMEDLTPDQSVIETVGREYLEELISGTRKIIGDFESDKTLPILQRLDKLKKILE